MVALTEGDELYGLPLSSQCGSLLRMPEVAQSLRNSRDKGLDDKRRISWTEEELPSFWSFFSFHHHTFCQRRVVSRGHSTVPCVGLVIKDDVKQASHWERAQTQQKPAGPLLVFSFQLQV